MSKAPRAMLRRAILCIMVTMLAAACGPRVEELQGQAPEPAAPAEAPNAEERVAGASLERGVLRSAALPRAAVVGRFEGEVDPFGGTSTLRFIPVESKDSESAALPGVGRTPRTGSQLALEQDETVLGYTSADCGATYWNAKFLEEGPEWRFWLPEGTPRTAFYQRLLQGPPDSDGEDALRFCTEFTLRNVSSNTYGDLWLMFDGIALERGYAFVDRVPRRLDELGPEGTDLEYAPVSDRGMFNYGPLAPSEEVSRQWYFYRAPGSLLQRFRVSGDVVEILHEQCGTGTDDNGDGIVDSGCGLGAAASGCYLDADCLSAACAGSVLDPDDVSAWTLGTCETSALGGACFVDTDCAVDLVCENADPGAGVPGTCAAETPAEPALGQFCDEDNDCGAGEWCPTETTEQRCAPRPTFSDGTVALAFQWVPAGAFTMGSPADEVGRNTNESLVEATLTRNLLVQRTPVTQAQWAAVMSAWNALEPGLRIMAGWSEATQPFGTDPSFFGISGQEICVDPDCPVESISWWEAVLFANVLSLLEGLDPCYVFTSCSTNTGVSGPGGGCGGESSCLGAFSCSSVSFTGKACTGYRLPTEAEWEFAARAGTLTATYNGDLEGTSCPQPVLEPIAWTICDSSGRTWPVAAKQANALGLYDMLGGVTNWTWNANAGTADGGTDPVTPTTGTSRMTRGGWFGAAVRTNRAAWRNNYSPTTRRRYLGLRLVRSVPVDPALDCGAPEAPDNGSVSAPSTGFQDVATYACDGGYTLEGSTQRTCLATGSWSGEAPQCTPPPALGDLCDDDDDCPSRAWCPTDTTERRCAPLETLGVDVELAFQFIPSGGQTFTAGSAPWEIGRSTNEGARDIAFLRDVFVLRTPITQAQWTAISGGSNPACFQTPENSNCSATNNNPNAPVERITWWSAIVYTNLLSDAAGFSPCYTLPATGCTGSWMNGTLDCDREVMPTVNAASVYTCEGYRLATEAEWEFAARAGTTTATYNGDLPGTSCPDTLTVLDDIGAYACNTSGHTLPVGSKNANAWGLADMLGNVAEWTWDMYRIAGSDGVDPVWQGAGMNRSHPGGHYSSDGTDLRAARRMFNSPNVTGNGIGFRIVRSAPVPPNVDCGLPSDPENGTVAVSGTTFGDTATYSCIGGHLLAGPEDRRCAANGEWIPSAPVCVPAPVGLGDPCLLDAQCPAGAWCPTDTDARHCAPNPLFGDTAFPFQYAPAPGAPVTLGSPEGEVGRNPINESQVEVTLTRSLFVQRTPVTHAQWSAVAEAWNDLPLGDRGMPGWDGDTQEFGLNPSYFAATGGCQDDDCPVERVNWFDAAVFANALSILEGLEPCYELTDCGTNTGVGAPGGGCFGTNNFCTDTFGGAFRCDNDVSFVGKECTGYRLATEAEWEFAARAGTTTATYGGNLSSDAGCAILGGTEPFPAGLPLIFIARYACPGAVGTRPAGDRIPNLWGIHDILGNVHEWTGSGYETTMEGGTDPLGPDLTTSDRVQRGGSWFDTPADTRAAFRSIQGPVLRDRSLGFRLVRTVLP